MRRLAASALIATAALALAPTAHAQSPAHTAARALESDPVYVHPKSADRLSVADRGRVRIAILRSAIGRIKVAVVPSGVADRAGSLEAFAHDIDNALQPRGALVVVAGQAYWVITSYPDSNRAAAAVRAAVSQSDTDSLGQELVLVARRLGRADPGPAADLRQGRGGGSGGASEIPDADDFLDDIGDAFRLGVLIVAAAIALPFVLLAAFLLVRARRRRASEREVHASHSRSADDELVELGDEIRSLDLDTSMPQANRQALTEYEQAISRYDQANELLEGERTAYEIQQARAAIAAGRRHIAAARALLG